MTGGSLRHRNLGVGDIGNAVDTVVDDHNYRNSRSRQKRQSLASRLIRLFIWTVLASLIFLLFNVPDQDTTITGTVGLTGMSVSLWDVWGFFGAPLVISSFLMYLECVVYRSDYDINLDEEDHEPHEEIGKALVKVSSSIKYFILNGQSLRSSPGTIEVW
ncbi:12862_t:CDS:2 [Entrophospora sp. SA101]|nr:12862_t:CDS:2 [Entrophospora sp. SA101]